MPAGGCRHAAGHRLNRSPARLRRIAPRRACAPGDLRAFVSAGAGRSRALRRKRLEKAPRTGSIESAATVRLARGREARPRDQTACATDPSARPAQGVIAVLGGWPAIGAARRVAARGGPRRRDVLHGGRRRLGHGARGVGVFVGGFDVPATAGWWQAKTVARRPASAASTATPRCRHGCRSGPSRCSVLQKADRPQKRRQAGGVRFVPVGISSARAPSATRFVVSRLDAVGANRGRLSATRTCTSTGVVRTCAHVVRLAVDGVHLRARRRARALAAGSTACLGARRWLGARSARLTRSANR